MPVNVNELARSLKEPWKPVVAAEANGFQLKVALLEGEFPWHAHAEEDELFFCLIGSFRIENEGAMSVTLSPGDTHVVAAGTRHRPVADEPAVALVFERVETKQHGDP
jgi:quercetin dioxygenase-like cupin family protein